MGGRQYLKNTSKLGDYLQRILSARVYDVAIKTPLQKAPVMSSRFKKSVYFKREDLQPVFSFKIRGAYNKIAHLDQEQQARGIVACSAGNHAQGVALSARELNLDAKIVMPEATPQIKVDAVRKLGGQVILHGMNFDQSFEYAKSLEENEDRTMIHPFDDPYVIAGQGTVAMEILSEFNGRPLDAIFVCCGGGGLLAGIAAYVKSVRSEVKVYGVEAEDAAGMTKSIEQGKVVTLDTVGLFADGAAVKRIGDKTFELCNEYVDDMFTVSTDEICAAIKLGFEETRSVLEPAGALAIAGLNQFLKSKEATGQSYVAITSGANMDFDRLRFVSERADATETALSVNIPETPGAFMKLYENIFPRNVTEFSYRFQEADKGAQVFLSFQSGGPEGEKDVVQALRNANFAVTELHDNEMAKAHGRYLFGGRSPSCKNELLYRFDFPERPGALKSYLDHIQPRNWNISLFHYRNHGADIGRVLIGVQVPPEESNDWKGFLETMKSLGYGYHDESDNVAYAQFLK